MLTLSDNNQPDVVEAFISTSRYLDDLLNIDYPYLEQDKPYPPPQNPITLKCDLDIEFAQWSHEFCTPPH